jgi:predicted Zn-dependent peptidase
MRSEPVSGEELTRAKESVKGRLVLSSESTAARMTRISRATLFGLPIESLDEMLAKVDAIAVDDLTELAQELYGADRLSAACVGADEDRFRRALAPVSEALVAA